ncbi:MAG: NADH-ubiquinone oxidoreductase-F iron-sulfur binding region domain-containing protein [Enterobacterales bacterium]|nr:NADH-ubiquinone oxidoreductase-F iron-sulfur binding region domain-containing protein [Enterobacterales bacterium]
MRIKLFIFCTKIGQDSLGHNYSGEDIEQLDSIVDELKTSIEVTSTQVTARHYKQQSFATESYLIENQLMPDISSFQVATKKLFNSSSSQQLENLLSSGLRGRGGAGFPTAIKWRSCAEQSEPQKYIICNADEGDPGAFSDRYLMEEQPLKLIFGMLFCAKIVASDSGFIYIRGEYPESIRIIKDAIQALEENNLLGQNILGSAFSFELQVVVGQGAYICGEETALIASIEGRRAEVDVRPPFPTQQGLYKKPTIVNNVETLAAACAIFLMSGEKYATIGNSKSTGTKLICLDGLFNNPGLYEVDMSTPLAFIIDKIGGGFSTEIKAVQIGGPLGGVVPVAILRDLLLDYESFSDAGFLLGHASFVCIPKKFSSLDYARHLFEFVADESCGKCFPCRIGSVRGSEMLINKNYNPELLDDLLDTMQHGSLCALGGGLPLAIKNLIQYFPDEFAGARSENISLKVL